jgi:hypothetical protein
MRAKDLAKGLSSSNPTIRRTTAQVIGLLDEVDVLPELSQAYQQETDATVKQALMWAGKRLNEAKANGYDTVQQLIIYSGMQTAVNRMPSEQDAREWQLTGQMTMTDIVNLRADLTVALDYQHPQEPNKISITSFIDDLKSQDPRKRSEAMVKAFESKNMAVIPHLAVIYLEENKPHLKEQAQNTAKYIYWNAISWQMHQDGTISEILEKMARQAGKFRPNADNSAPTPAAQAPKLNEPAKADDIDAILRKAEEERRKRRRK